LRLHRHQNAVGAGWAGIVRARGEKARAVGAKLLVGNTLPDWAGLAGEEENDAGKALQAIRPLRLTAAAKGLAVVVIRHDRKSGGEPGQSGRGSSAFAGAMDTIVQIARAGDGAPRNRRTLRSVSRFSEVP